MPNDVDTEEALLRLRAVVRDNPRSTAFVALAHTLSDLGRDDEAEEVSRQGLAQHPQLVTGQVALGRALIGRGRLREAQERLVEAARANPEHGDVFRWLGELVLRRGQKNQARTLLEYAEELMPSDARVTELLLAAGGQPQPRLARPKTDFEDTRVGDIRKLAERMHEDPPPARRVATPNGARKASGDEAITAEFEPHAGKPAGKNGAGKNGVAAARLGDVPPVAAPGTFTKGVAAARPAGSAARPRQDLAARARALLARVQSLWSVAGPAQRWSAMGALALVLAAVAWLLAPAGAPAPAGRSAGDGKPLVAAVDMTAAIAAGTLDGLTAVRALGKSLLESGSRDGDQLAAAAFASALLASDYGVAGTADALELAGAAAKLTPPKPLRSALVEASRALVALSAGRLAEAQAAAGRGVAAAGDSAEAQLALGRTMLRAGKLPEAQAALGKAVARVPVIAAAVLDRAAAAVDAANPDAAATELGGLLARQDDLRARLVLSEAERLAGKPISSKGLKERCREEGRDSPILRTSCAAELAMAARLAGDRAAAVRAARTAIVGGGRNPRGLAHGVMVLANVGEVASASEALRKIRDDTGPGFVPRIFAALAVTLGRGEEPDAALKPPTPTSPEARLVAARIAYRRGGAEALAAHLATVDAKFLEQDPDLAAFALLAAPPPIDPARLAKLEERADKGATAAYVLGRIALAAGDPKTAGGHLQRAMQVSGEACEAARLLLGIDKKQRPQGLASDARVLAQLRAHNPLCAGR